jgi:hypothetical protein
MANEKVKVPFFKKWWVWLIIGFIIGGITFSGGGSETTSPETKITDEKDTETEVKESETPAKEETPVKEEPKVEEKAPVVVYQDDKVIISFKEVSAEGVKFLMENKTDKELTVQADSVAVNGFSSNDITMSDAVAPQSKGYITARTSELADAGAPETLSGKLRVIDFTGNWETYDVTFTNVSVK